VSGSAPAVGQIAAKTRYRQADAPCELVASSSTDCKLLFEAAQWAVTPGQSAVLYDGDICLGGGVIAGSNVQNT
jgi:tRNA-uridine 2-sulfurtransferase